MTQPSDTIVRSDTLHPAIAQRTATELRHVLPDIAFAVKQDSNLATRTPTLQDPPPPDALVAEAESSPSKVNRAAAEILGSKTAANTGHPR